jgi:hypothetical protein
VCWLRRRTSWCLKKWHHDAEIDNQSIINALATSQGINIVGYLYPCFFIPKFPCGTSRLFRSSAATSSDWWTIFLAFLFFFLWFITDNWYLSLIVQLLYLWDFSRVNTHHSRVSHKVGPARVPHGTAIPAHISREVKPSYHMACPNWESYTVTDIMLQKHLTQWAIGPNSC